MSAITVEEADAIQPAQARMSPPSPFGDKAFYWLTLSMAFAVVLLVILIGWELGQGSWQAIQKFGFHFLTTSKWDPVAEEFGALPFIYGTVVSSLIALLIAVEHCDGGLPDRTRAALDPATDHLAHRNAGRDPQRDSRVVGNFRDDPLAARLSVCVSEADIRLDSIFQWPDLRPMHAGWWNHCSDYDSADHHVGLARNPAERP